MKESQRGTRSWGDTCGDVEHLVLIEQLLIEGVEGLIAQSRGGVIKFLSYCKPHVYGGVRYSVRYIIMFPIVLPGQIAFSTCINMILNLHI